MHHITRNFHLPQLRDGTAMQKDNCEVNKYIDCRLGSVGLKLYDVEHI